MAHTRTVLITGGAGFIGSHLSRRLLDDGAEVRALDNFLPNYDLTLKRHNVSMLSGHDGYTFIECDILGNDLDPLVDGCDAVVHLAARAGVRPSLEDPGRYAATNIDGTVRLLEAVRRCDVERVVFASSSSVYGDSTPVPFSESHPDPRPISPYGWSKLAGEALCRLYHDLYGIHIVALRFFTVYGPGQRPDMGIHRFIAAAETGATIEMYGNGSTSRDYTYIDDIIAAIGRALDLRPGFEVINLGNSSPVTLSELIGIIERVTGHRIRTVRKPIPTGDMLRTHADVARARRLLGYRPSTPLVEGIRAQVEWYRSMAAGGLL